MLEIGKGELVQNIANDSLTRRLSLVRNFSPAKVNVEIGFEMEPYFGKLSWDSENCFENNAGFDSMDDVSLTFVKTLIEFQKFGFPNNNFQIAHSFAHQMNPLRSHGYEKLKMSKRKMSPKPFVMIMRKSKGGKQHS